MKDKILIILLLFTYSFFGQEINSDEKFKGIEIYLFKKNIYNNQSYLTYSKRKRKRLFNKYKETKEMPDSVCQNYIDLKKNHINENVFLNKSDIDYYLLKEHTIFLNKTGIEKLINLSPSLHERFFMISYEGESIFAARFWGYYSSQIPDGVYAKIQPNYNKIKIDFLFCGKDHRSKISLKAEKIKNKELEFQKKIGISISKLHNSYSKRKKIANYFIEKTENKNIRTENISEKIDLSNEFRKDSLKISNYFKLEKDYSGLIAKSIIYLEQFPEIKSKKEYKQKLKLLELLENEIMESEKTYDSIVDKHSNLMKYPRIKEEKENECNIKIRF